VLIKDGVGMKDISSMFVCRVSHLCSKCSSKKIKVFVYNVWDNAFDLMICDKVSKVDRVLCFSKDDIVEDIEQRVKSLIKELKEKRRIGL
jgi:hypothetical protein